MALRAPRWAAQVVTASAGAGDAPDVGPVKRWAYGIAFAAVPLGLGIFFLIDGRAWMLSRRGFWAIDGLAAVFAALAWIGLGLFMHFHFFWDGRPRGWRVARVGKPLSLLLFGGGLLAASVIFLLRVVGW